MPPTVRSYIESVSNPGGHFTTLGGVSPRRDPFGVPLFSVRSLSVDFPVFSHGEELLLKCLLSEGETRERMRAFCAATAGLESPHFARCDYLPGEIAVVDSLGRGTLRDVMVQHLPRGETLCDFLEGCCLGGEREPLRLFARGVARLSAWMAREGIAHRNLKPSYIRVGRGHVPVPLHYDYAVANAGREDVEGDRLPLLSLSLAATVLAAAPELYLAMGRERIFSPAALRALHAALSGAGPLPNPLSEAFTAVSQGRTPAADLLERVAGVELRLEEGFAGRAATHHIPDAAEPPIPRIRACEPRRAESPAADDLEAGRAAATLDGAWGLVDERGRFVIPPIYDEVVWDAESGLASVCADGRWGLCDGHGRQFTGLLYDWTGSPREGLILARRGGKFGFLNTGGGAAIDFIYDGASSFGGGVAPVRIGQEEFHIDRLGRRTR